MQVWQLQEPTSMCNVVLKLLEFLSADGAWLLRPSSVFLLSGGTVQPESTYSCVLKMTGQV